MNDVVEIADVFSGAAAVVAIALSIYFARRQTKESKEEAAELRRDRDREAAELRDDKARETASRVNAWAVDEVGEDPDANGPGEPTGGIIVVNGTDNLARNLIIYTATPSLDEGGSAESKYTPDGSAAQQLSQLPPGTFYLQHRTDGSFPSPTPLDWSNGTWRFSDSSGTVVLKPITQRPEPKTLRVLAFEVEGRHWLRLDASALQPHPSEDAVMARVKKELGDAFPKFEQELQESATASTRPATTKQDHSTHPEVVGFYRELFSALTGETPVVGRPTRTREELTDVIHSVELSAKEQSLTLRFPRDVRRGYLAGKGRGDLVAEFGVRNDEDPKRFDIRFRPASGAGSWRALTKSLGDGPDARLELHDQLIRAVREQLSD